MFIERVQVEEGFLDGLDLELSPGLNTIIGARGAGKSSLIELIRFCLNAKGHTGTSISRSFEHAVSVLKDGQVTVTIRNGLQKIIVSRTASQDTPEFSAQYPSPIVFSQSEIEAVGLDATGRLRLLDGFLANKFRANSEELGQIGIIRSLTNDAARLRQDIIDHEDRLAKLPDIIGKLNELAPKEEKVAKVSSEAANKTKLLETLTSKISGISVNSNYVERFNAGIEEWENEVIRSLSFIPIIEGWDDAEYHDPLAEQKKLANQAEQNIKAGLEAIKAARLGATTLLEKASSGRQALEDQARTMRSEIEILQTGAGEVVRQGQKLREEKIQLEALQKVVKDKKIILSGILSKRSDAMTCLEEIRQNKFALRSQSAETLSNMLAPQIHIDVIHAKQIEGYAAAIADALRGSGLQYKELAPKLASLVGPRELINMVDDSDVEGLVDIASVSQDRAYKILASLRDADIGDIATIQLEDEVLFQLLDGGDYKNFTELSTGQRCTVILPIILEHRERILAIDQPEDHIDNAFITNTLIAAISRRSREGQMILSTHNANIPVLGGAERVVHLGSDGRRGYVEISGSLSEPKVVEAITSVMEGGVEAFRRRAEFYKLHSND